MASGFSKLQLILGLDNRLKNGLNGAKNQVTKATGGMQSKLDAFSQKNVKMLDAVKTQVPGIGSALSMLSNPYLAAAAGVAAVGTAIYKSTKMANEWEKGMAKINVTAGLGKQELKGLSKELLEIGGRNVADIETIPEAFNRIISAGLDVDTSLKVLEPSLRAAKAGFVDVEVAASAAVGVMNASGRDINTVYDVLFETLNKGNAEFSDIAQYLPKIVPMARNAGVSLEQTAGAWAYLTAQGQTAERATTLMQNAMKSITDPEKIKNFKKMKIDLFDKKGNIKSLTDIVDIMASKTAGMSDKMRAQFYGNLGLDTEAASFFASATQNADKFRETIDEVTNSQGALKKAYNDSLTPMENWAIIKNKIKQKMIEIGQVFLPIISKIGFGVLSIIEKMQTLWKESTLLRDVFSAIGKVFTWLFKIIFIPIKQMINLFSKLRENVSMLGIEMPKMDGGIEAFYLKIKPYLTWISQMLGGVADIMYNIATFNFKGAYQAFKNFKLPNIEDIKVKQKLEIEAKKKEEAQKKEEQKTQGTATTTTTQGKSNYAADTISSGSQSKSVTVNIKSFIENMSPQNKSIAQMNPEQLQQFMIDTFMKITRSAELMVQ